ncbi:LLM class flavin-dependent oxidoreductase [Arthrobacter sp. GMC3]|uniref:LLM class flavin-dependent oxidoreductase n=1 Tax=Arthrobacter sp. GMC3 TaxID=2058894 RepID=UPI000CE456AE|nr:LLM class flavin-dependent oxidoreductase [Arthrobacter sp. GMC3]
MNHIPAAPRGFTPTGRLHFGVNLVGPAADLTFEQLRGLAQTAERGLFSLLTLDERYWLGDDPGASSSSDPAGSSDVAALQAALAAVTGNIGLAVAAAPDYDDPASLVHRIASLDKISGGRAAWNLLADGARHGEANSGSADHSQREEFLAAAQRIWDTWGAATDFSLPARGPVETLGAFQRDGQLFSVGVGALHQPGPRYRPVVIHAGDTLGDRRFGTRHADVLTTAPAGISQALALRKDIAASVMGAGRSANDVKILQGATFILAETAGEAREKAEWLRGQLPQSAWDDQAFVGSYSGVADLLLDFARSGAVDGFNVMPWLYPTELAEIVNHLVPELQERGIYPTDYAADSLRDILCLPGSARSAAAPTAHALPVIEVGDLNDIHLDLDLRMELIVQKMGAS